MTKPINRTIPSERTATKGALTAPKYSEAIGGLFAKVVSEIQRLTTPPEVKIERVRVSEYFSGSFESADQVKKAVAHLQDHLMKLLDEGVKIVVE
jgi:hypothetical protein